MVPGRTHPHLGRLPIETAPLAALLEEDALELVYFPARLLGGSFPPFFFRGARGFFLNRSQPPDPLVDLPERAAKFAEAVVFGNFALRLGRLAGEENVSVTVWPSTFRVKR